ncbi:hypothetical protein ACKGJI_01575 [Sulfurospirillum sp. 1307]
MENIRDIKGLIEINEYSLYVFIALIIIFIAIIWYLFKVFKNRKKGISKEKIAKNELKKIDLKNAKKSAYKLSKYIPVLNSDIDLSFLDKYKYKKIVEDFSEEDLQKIEEILRGTNV